MFERSKLFPRFLIISCLFMVQSCKRKIWECIDPEERKQYFEKKQKKSENQSKQNECNKENSTTSSKNISQKQKESAKVVEKPQKAITQTPLTRTDIELKVFVMKVVELKKELKARGQDTAGLKKDLRNRLIDVMLEDTKREEPQALSTQNNSVIVEESPEELKESASRMSVSEVEEKSTQALPLSMKNGKPSRESQGSVCSMQVEHHIEAVEQPKEIQKDNFPNPFALELKKKQAQVVAAPKEYVAKTESSLTAIREVDPVSSNSTSAQTSNESSDYNSQSRGEEKSELTESKIKKFSEVKKGSDSREDSSGPPSEISCSSKASGNSVKDMVSKFSGFSSSLSSSSGGSALSKGLQAKKEARQAKIAEMRAKVRLKNLCINFRISSFIRFSI